MPSQSQNSGSGTISRDSRRLLKRGPRIRQLNDSDWRWLWAAYEMGLWRELIDSDLPIQAFRERMFEIVGAVPYDWIIEARGNEGLRPVGLILAKDWASGRGIEPHIDWFPWATPRNKFEGIATFLREVGKRLKIIVYTDAASEEFYIRMTRYRILRKGCRILDYYARGEHSLMFYTSGP